MADDYQNTVAGYLPRNDFLENIVDNALDVVPAAEHTKNKRPSTHDQHTKKRPGGPEKKKSKKDWKIHHFIYFI